MNYHGINVSIEAYESFLRNHPYGSYFQSSTQAKAHRKGGYATFDWAAIADDSGELVGGSLAMLKKVPHTPFSYAYIRSGFVLDYDAADWQEQAKILWDNTLLMLKRHRVLYLRFDLPVTEARQDVIDFYKAMGAGHKGFYHDNAHSTYYRFRSLLDISGSEDDILTGFNQLVRRCLRKAEHFKLKFEFGTLDDIELYQKLKEETSERNQFDTYDLATSKAIFQALSEDNIGHLVFVRLLPSETIPVLQHDLLKYRKDLETVLARPKVNPALVRDNERAIEKIEGQINELIELQKRCPDGVVLSTAILIEFGRRMYYYLAGSSNSYRDYQPNHFMIWTIIKLAKAKGCDLFDFGGVEPDESDLSEFKKRWNAVTYAYSGDLDYVLNKPLGGLLKKLMKK